MVIPELVLVGCKATACYGIACRDPGSNRGPSDLQSDPLPAELLRPCGLWDLRLLAGVSPPTCCIPPRFAARAKSIAQFVTSIYAAATHAASAARPKAKEVRAELLTNLERGARPLLDIAAFARKCGGRQHLLLAASWRSHRKLARHARFAAQWRRHYGAMGLRMCLRHAPAKNGAREIRAPSLLIRGQTRCRCAIAPLAAHHGSAVVQGVFA